MCVDVGEIINELRRRGVVSASSVYAIANKENVSDLNIPGKILSFGFRKATSYKITPGDGNNFNIELFVNEEKIVKISEVIFRNVIKILGILSKDSETPVNIDFTELEVFVKEDMPVFIVYNRYISVIAPLIVIRRW